MAAIRRPRLRRRSWLALGCLAFVAVLLGSWAFWLEPRHREVDTWKEHRDISEVMLATSLLPDGVLVLPSHGPLGAAARSG